jgi:hypothetical protein
MEKDDLIKVEGEQNLFRDRNTGAIINTDTAGYNRYMKMKQRKSKQNREIDQLKDEISELKGMLKTLLDNNK